MGELRTRVDPAWSAGELTAFVAAGWRTPRELLQREPESFLRRMPGRETFLLEHGALRSVAKRAYEPLRPWARLFALDRASAAAREHANLLALAEVGIPVPRAIGWAEQRERVRVASIVVMEHVAHTETLRQLLARASAGDRRRWSARLLELVLRLHGSGWYHRDLYLQHFVVRGDELVLLDVGRARKEHAPRERWFVKDVAALLHSTPRAVTPRERLAFLARYLDGRGIAARAARRHFLARVVAKERRMAAHAPRSGEDQPWSDR